MYLKPEHHCSAQDYSMRLNDEQNPSADIVRDGFSLTGGKGFQSLVLRVWEGEEILGHAL